MHGELLAVVRGRVQGVGFRRTARRLGEQLQLSGFVRNLPEGSVEVCAQGARDHLEELIVRLKREFPTASFETVYRQVGQKYSGFTIF